jgi:acetolactate synthase-1/2/3 large subunit
MEAEVTVADYFAAYISEKGVSTIYELSGGMIAFLSDAIYRYGKTKIINTRHEQSAGFSAEAATRVTGIPNVAMATSGPGATNLITAIASSYFDSSPTIFITGQVHSQELRKNNTQRQNGFQELDIVQATNGLTKFAAQVKAPQDFPELLNRAWKIALEGRPGPVLIDIPIDIQQMACKDSFPKPEHVVLASESDSSSFDRLKMELSLAKRPLVLAGGGIRTSNTLSEFHNFIERLNIPVVQTLMGKDSLTTAHPLNLGFIGSYGNRWANRALSRSDFLLVLGSRLDERQTGGDIHDFTKQKFIARVDIDPNELSGRVSANLDFLLGLKEFFQLSEKVAFPKLEVSHVLNDVATDRSNFTSKSEQQTEMKISPDECIKWISRVSSSAEGFCVDVGQHQMWAVQSIELMGKQRFITSGGMGAMGFSIPAAIGATCASSGRWVTITGDGCMQLSISELQTIFHYKLPITMFVLNNRQHGMVAQFQDENLEARHVATRIGYSTPDFCAVAKAYGIDAYKVNEISDFKYVEAKITARPTSPILVEIEIQDTAKALPKIDRFTKLSQL